jgi:hypothetical protein
MRSPAEVHVRRGAPKTLVSILNIASSCAAITANIVAVVTEERAIVKPIPTVLDTNGLGDGVAATAGPARLYLAVGGAAIAIFLV